MGKFSLIASSLAGVAVIFFILMAPNQNYVTSRSLTNTPEEVISGNDAWNTENVSVLGQYTDVKELSNIKLDATVQEVTYQNFHTVFKGVLDYSSDNKNDAGYFLTSSKKLVYYPLYEISYLRNGQSPQKIYSYQLPDTLSDDLSLTVLTEGFVLVQDKKQNLLMTIEVDHPDYLYDPVKPGLVERTIKFSAGSKAVKIITGYSGGDSYFAEISDEQNNVYRLNLIDLTLSNTMHGENWRTVSGFTLPSSARSDESDVFLYQVDDVNHKLRKIDRNTNQELYQLDLNAVSIHGEIEKVVNDGELIYLLVKENRKLILYQTNDKLLNFVKKTEGYLDGTSWDTVDNLWYYDNGNNDLALAIFDKQSLNVINFLDIFGWTRVK